RLNPHRVLSGGEARRAHLLHEHALAVEVRRIERRKILQSEVGKARFENGIRKGKFIPICF
ncbi:MAG TPA: hypothetical protein VHN11_19345, partial [Xanthobacteraceae bacterium]|nr:hypothetical protein [Xanthobacteraceae bacterium]